MPDKVTHHQNTNCNELVFPIESYTVAAWTPERDGKGTCTEVHVELRGRGMERPFVLRLKSRERVQNFIDLLTEYRDIVWPKEG